MPFLAPIIPVIAGIAGIAGTGITLGETLSNSGGGGGSADQSKLLAQQQRQQAQQDELAKQKAIQANLANSQQQTGGDVNNQTLVDLASIISGLPGETNTASGKGALAAFLGTPNSQPQDNLVSATYGINGSQG